MATRGVWLAAAGLLFAVVTAGAAAASVTPTVVLLVFDGLAPSLFEPEAPPALRRIQREGAFSHHLIPEYPTGDSVGMFSLSTGCRPETHGVVNDEFLDPERGVYEGALDSSWMLACEHLHAVARRQGLRVATWDWFEGADGTASGDPGRRVADLVRALQLPENERPQLLIAHFGGPQDVVGRAGLRSNEAREAAVQVDAIVARVMQAIEALPADSATLIVATNHGLLPVWTEVNLPRILREHGLDLEFAAAGATAFVYVAKKEDEQAAITAFNHYQRQLQVYLKRAQLPERQLGDGARVGDLILVAIPPYIFESPRRWWTGTAWLAPWLPELVFARPFVKAGAGYPPSVRGMPGALYAWGAGIARVGELTRLKLVDLHPTICRMLGISPGAPVDGTVVGELLSTGSEPEQP